MAAGWEYNATGGIRLLDGTPKRTKKITGTRLGAVLGLNRWKSPFGAWCEITKTAEVPFEGSASTEAGNIIEPKQIQWYKENVNATTISAEEYFGARFPQVKYDFYPENPIFGGMWDAATRKPDGHTLRGIIECKTTKRRQDWDDGPPIYYSIQAAEYAYLQRCDRFTMVVSFLEDKDLERPELFVPTAENTKVFDFMLYDYIVTIDGVEYNIEQLMNMATEWHTYYVKAGVSPAFDEKRDKDFLAILRLNCPENDSELWELGLRATAIRGKIDTIKKETGLDALEKEKKAIEDSIKALIIEEFTENDEKVAIQGWEVTKSFTETVDKEALKRDGVFDKYVTTKPSFRLQQKKEK